MKRQITLTISVIICLRSFTQIHGHVDPTFDMGNYASDVVLDGTTQTQKVIIE
jgi:hypothetical protein